MNTDDIVDQLQEGAVGVLPTDTLYGLVGSALIPETVEKIYEIKKRNPEKPLIVLISAIDDLERFGVVVSDRLRSQLEEYWPGQPAQAGPVSIVLPTIDETFEYLSRGQGTIAFRLPNDGDLLALLSATGPLVAPSANPEGLPPAETIEEAKDYFGDSVSFYLDGGEKKGLPSRVISVDEDGQVFALR